MAWAFGPVMAAAGDSPAPLAVPTHQHWNALEPVLAGGDGTGSGQAASRNASNPICATTATGSTNVNTDCNEAAGPHNETSIAVNPSNHSNLIGGANDYQLSLSNGGTLYETIYTRAHVSLDGGATWSFEGLGNQYNAYSATGDPAVAFDADGRAYLATLGFGFSQGRGCCRNPDVIANTSTDGGLHWGNFTRVASGSGVFGGPGTFNDKEYITAWGHGNAIVTWTVFNDGFKGSYISSPIFDSVTHDGGATWSAPQEISGSAAFCVSANAGEAANVCDQNQFSDPVVAADGTIRVAFENTYNNDPTSAAFNRDQYLVVSVDPTTGARTAGPYVVAQLVDGTYDAPINEDGRQTYQDSEFRSNSSGNIAADPTNKSHLAVTWSDWRNGTLPGPTGTTNPYSVATNADVFVSESADGGVTWSAPEDIAASGDQFQPWGAFDSSGTLRVGYFDRSYDSANHMYGYTLATETSPGTFSTTQLTNVLSDPTTGDRWFSGRTPNLSFPNPSSFIGDYSNLAAAGTGVVALWTDLRIPVSFGSRSGTGQDAFEAAHS
jgi:hypothetical protein